MATLPASPPPASTAPPEPAGVAPAAVPGLTGLLSLAIGVVVVAALYFGRDVLVPIMLAVLLSFLLAPLVAGLRRLRLGRVPAVVVAVLLALGVIGMVGTVIGGQVATLATEVPRYTSTIRAKIEAAQDTTVARLPATLGRLARQIQGAGAAARTPEPGAERAPVPVEVHEPPASPLATARAVLAPIVGPLETTILVVIVAVFILLQRDDLRDRVIRLFGSTDLHRTTTAMDEAAARLSRYFLTQLALNSAFGIVIGVGLYLLGVPSPVLWGILAAIMRFVPYVGAFIAAIPPLVLAAAVAPDWGLAIGVAILFATAEPLMGYVVEPLVYGHSTGLSPTAVIVAAIFWTWLWGPIGLILSTPLTLCLVVLGRHVERLEFLDVLLGDRPALTPVEAFYQRMLAGDADEALDQAEGLLKDRSLASYYDEVALKGLQLAAADAGRGVLPANRIDCVRDTAAALIDDLSDHDDEQPDGPPGASAGDVSPVAPSAAEQAVPAHPAIPDVDDGAIPAAWAKEGAILCIAGRGALDEAAAAMLAQLLTKHGLGARVVPHRVVGRDRIRAFDAGDARMICISYLEIAGAPSHLRYLVRRLRRAAPDLPLLVGLWPPRSDAANDPRAMVNADMHVETLHAAVAACLAQATGLAEPAPEALAAAE